MMSEEFIHVGNCFLDPNLRPTKDFISPFHNGPQRPRPVSGFVLLQTCRSGRFCPVHSIGKSTQDQTANLVNRARIESETTFTKHRLGSDVPWILRYNNQWRESPRYECYWGRVGNGTSREHGLTNHLHEGDNSR